MEELSWYLLCYTFYINGEAHGQGDVTFFIKTPKFTGRNLQDLRNNLVEGLKSEAPEDVEITVNFNSLTFLCTATEEEFYS